MGNISRFVVSDYNHCRLNSQEAKYKAVGPELINQASSYLLWVILNVKMELYCLFLIENDLFCKYCFFLFVDIS